MTVCKGDKSAEATKLMALMAMGVKCGDTVTVNVEGGDEEATFASIKDFFENNL
ncbi:HPr family phosphocarrier protein [Lachnospira sp.]|uniref:HPr family phosphocarrier protein n=1 Tax=Lachnospira sp. TaxID=2049031 RepID=UPI00257FF976|nr:HPr family phosphocarrier protein [Lachnospira sp.]